VARDVGVPFHLLAWALAGSRPYAFDDYRAWLASITVRS